jgi:arsenite methyltransferase
VISVHRHALGVSAEDLREDAVAAGFERVEVDLRTRRFNSPAVELTARR